MSRFKSHPIFYSALVVLGLAVLAEGWLVYDRHTAAVKTHRLLDNRERELRAFGGVTPAPTDDMAAQVETDRERTARALEAMQAELQGRGSAADQIKSAPSPAQRPDAFFDIARFVEAMRAKAGRLEVAAKPDEAFGFASHAHSGPELELIPYVFKQRLIAQYLVEAAFDARPRRFDGLQRDRPLTASQRQQRAQALAAGQAASQPAADGSAGAGGAADFFTIDERISARRAGFVDTMAFRVTFSGQTSALRTFLNKLASFELPLVVRSVEVEPAADLKATSSQPAARAASTFDSIFGSSPATAAAPAADLPVPLVVQNDSKFTVTVEFVDLVPPAS